MQFGDAKNGQQKRAMRVSVDLQLGIKRKLSRRNDAKAAEAEKEFEHVKLAILKRDNYTCVGCGASTLATSTAKGGYFEVHHIDDDHHNSHPSNLVTLCPYCHQLFTFGNRGGSFYAGLMYMPEISHASLNRLVHAVSFAGFLSNAHKEGDLKLEASSLSRIKAIEQGFEQFIEIGDKRFAEFVLLNELEGFDSIETIYASLITLNDKEYSRRHLFLDGVRLVPKLDMFEKQILFWSQEVWLKGVKPSAWDGLMEQTLADLKEIV